MNPSHEMNDKIQHAYEFYVKTKHYAKFQNKYLERKQTPVSTHYIEAFARKFELNQ